MHVNYLNDNKGLEGVEEMMVTHLLKDRKKNRYAKKCLDILVVFHVEQFILYSETATTRSLFSFSYKFHFATTK